MMQRSTDLPKKLKQKVVLEQPIWKESQKFKADHFWPLLPKCPPRNIMQKAAQFFKSLNHAMISWTTYHNNEYSIYQNKKVNQLWYSSISSKPLANLPLLVSKSEEKSSADAIFTPKTVPSETDPIKDILQTKQLANLRTESYCQNATIPTSIKLS